MSFPVADIIKYTVIRLRALTVLSVILQHWAKRMGNKNINVKTSRGTNLSTVGVDIGDWVFEKKIRGQSSYGPVVFRYCLLSRSRFCNYLEWCLPFRYSNLVYIHFFVYLLYVHVSNNHVRWRVKFCGSSLCSVPILYVTLSFLGPSLCSSLRERGRDGVLNVRIKCIKFPREQAGPKKLTVKIKSNWIKPCFIHRKHTSVWVV
jgi:hypothetical protein